MSRLVKVVEGIFRGPRRIVTDRWLANFFAARDFDESPAQGVRLNDQSGRAAILAAIIVQCRIERIVETGTFRGATTAWFADFGLPVHTVEANPRFAQFARLRFASSKLIQTAEMDSARYLRQLGEDRTLTGARTLFYLDAHWGGRLPLGDEIRAVADAFPFAIIVIDDFQVPDDADYGFDNYGPGKRLDLDYVKRSGAAGFKGFFPVLRGAKEDGARRGCVVLTADAALADRLSQIPLLRHHAL